MSTPQIMKVKIIAPINNVIVMVSFSLRPRPAQHRGDKKRYLTDQPLPVMHRTPPIVPPKLTGPANEE